MSGLIESTYLRALELDDEFPDDVCPGCQQDITGWRRHERHYRGRPGDVARFVGRQTSLGRVCPWGDDYLTARAFRRSYIAGWSA